ncbi:ribose-phosphate diphosphokinase [Sinorhizobium meliloti]|uniref:ribose-phosphate diphosphokinase n=1 Tax=Rhizobium meliloti TaxID=382 RepID=UPI0012967B80|nr:ribose-phosphate diphosphokinase [Sinorhizobium meliloti]MDW9688385.1 ribose-phosphate diphosphokinase [Sinorhizobium meliloti]MQU97068.1 ribose-phosphate diphosphokinase [Sinorhizobium meliloti]MQV12989.1 ribose-phosphate diphosphokinase [Sinorhizobium meliloti]
MNRVLLPFPLQRTLAEATAPLLDARVGRLDWRHFPDGESLITIDESLDGVDVAVVATLRDPDELALPLRFAAATAREFGARSVGLVAPYLGYMRQDKRFNPGEAISAPLFARFLEESFDWLVTADPHLHRNPELSKLYHIPVRRVATAPLIANWIRDNLPQAILIGPDSESEQWVSAIARRAGIPYQVLTKIRRGDRDVEVSLPSIDAAWSRNPIIVDDIVSSGRTLIETIGHLKRLGLPPAVCIVIHPVFAQDAYTQLLATGVDRVVSTDSIPHPSNAISIAGLLAKASIDLFGDERS